MNGLTQKQEQFTRNLFKGMNQSEAYRQAGYAVQKQAPTTIKANASRLANNVNVLAKLDELNEKADIASIATEKERRQKLTEILRGNLLDYQEVGADGSYLDIDRSKPNTGAIAEITSRTEYDKDGANAALITKVRLHNPVPAIDLLNKMEKLYTDGATQNIDNRTLNIIVSSEKTKDLTERLIAGERTGGDNGHKELKE